MFRNTNLASTFIPYCRHWPNFDFNLTLAQADSESSPLFTPKQEH